MRLRLIATCALLVPMLASASPVAVGAQGRPGLELCRQQGLAVSASFMGTSGDDIIIGTPGDDVIRGGGGNDVLCGRGGNDVILGGSGDDQIDGGAGDDRLLGGTGDDRIEGSAGRDRIGGMAGDDELHGGNGPDRLIGGADDDALHGGAGRDRLDGGTGRDRLFGLGGPDVLRGGNGPDRLDGGSGSDVLDGGAGADRLTADASDSCGADPADVRRGCPARHDAPNIVIINLDDARPEVMDVLPLTSWWFGTGGTTWTNAFVSTPSCCPSRATLMTGQYVHNNGQVDQTTPLTNEWNTVQRHLDQAGWFTAHSGKYLHYYDVGERAPHWDRWTYFRGGYTDVRVDIDGVVQQAAVHSTVLTFDSAIRYIDAFEAADDSTPFYVHVAPVAPHTPFDPEPQFADAPVPDWTPPPSVGEVDRSDKPPEMRFVNRSPAEGERVRVGQLRQVMSVDAQVDRLFRTLDAHGELDNTLAIFTSDNGYLWGEHGRTKKFVPYTEAVHVPLLIRWPGRVAAGASSDDLVSHVDLAPTMLAAAGVDAEHVMDGRNLLAPDFVRTNVLTEYWEDPANANFIPDWASIRNERRVYTEYYGPGGGVVFREFYDLAADPWELNNLLADGDPRNDPDLTWVENRLDEYRRCRGNACG